MKKFEEKYFTNNIYVGIRNDYHKSQKNGKGNYTQYYDGFVFTPWGLKSLSKGQVYEVKEGITSVDYSHASEVEPVIFYMDKDEIPSVMTKEEILEFVCGTYAPIRREIYYSELGTVQNSKRF